jgi:hypothetical protein
VADATKLDGLEDRFDTVVDSAFYHVFGDDEGTQTRYARALHRGTKPGARLFMFELGRHNVNGLQWEGLPADNFERVLSAAGWRIDYLGTTTYQGTFGPATFTNLSKVMASNPEMGRADEAGSRSTPSHCAVAEKQPGAYAGLGGDRHPRRLTPQLGRV